MSCEECMYMDSNEYCTNKESVLFNLSCYFNDMKDCDKSKTYIKLCVNFEDLKIALDSIDVEVLLSQDKKRLSFIQYNGINDYCDCELVVK